MSKHGDGGEDGEEHGQQVEADRQLECHKMSHRHFLLSSISFALRASSQHGKSVKTDQHKMIHLRSL